MKHPMFLPQFVLWMLLLLVALGLIMIIVVSWIVFVGHPG